MMRVTLFARHGAVARLQALPRRHEDWRSLLSTCLRGPYAGVISGPRHLHTTLVEDGTVVSEWGPAGDRAAHRQSAVLVLLTPLEREADGTTSGRVVEDLVCTLTMRQDALRAHSGQMSFPGGRCDRIEGGAWEAPADAASRETLEEVGIARDSYDILGALDPVWSGPSRAWVTPVVALGRPSPAAADQQSAGVGAVLPPAARAVIASPDEVASIHYASLTGLLDHSSQTHHRLLMDVPLQTAQVLVGAHHPYNLHAYRHGNATARMLMPCFLAANAHANTTSSHAHTDRTLEKGSNDDPELAVLVHCAASGSLRPSAATSSDSKPSVQHAAIAFGEQHLSVLSPRDVGVGRSLVWGLTAFMLGELVARITAARLAANNTTSSTASASSSLSTTTPGPLAGALNITTVMDVAPYLPCSNFAIGAGAAKSRGGSTASTVAAPTNAMGTTPKPMTGSAAVLGKM